MPRPRDRLTALATFDRLECEGRYRADPAEAERSVLVKFGYASLMILTFDDEPITHWPLASLHRASPPGERSLELAPEPTAPERLVIDDPTMVAAIGTVCGFGRARRPRGRVLGRLLRVAVAAAVVAGVVLGGRWGLRHWPEVLVAGLPQAAEARIGEAALRVLAGDTRCETAEGRRALDALSARLAPGEAKLWLMVGRTGDAARGAIAAPGGWVLVDPSVIARARSPADVAGPLAVALAGHADAAVIAAGLAEAGFQGLMAVVSGRFDSDPLARGVAGALAARAAVAPAPEAATELGERIAAAARTAATPAQDWRAIKTICAR
jgi:hypothetical protein